MVSTFTPNIQLEEPARGDDVGTWDTPVNGNMSLIDLVSGGIQTFSAAAGSVVLSAPQFQANELVIVSTLIASITLTLPTSFKKPYSVYHLATGSSAFTITLATTAAGGQAIAVPPGEVTDILNEGNNIRFRNLGRVGSYVDYAGSSIPNWVTGCTVPPYLNTDGTTFSSATYPILATILGSTTLPDFRGRAPHYLNQGTARLTQAGAGIDGNTIFANGGTNGVALGSSHIPTHTSSGNNSITVTSSVNLAGTDGTVVAGSFGGGANVFIPQSNGNWRAITAISNLAAPILTSFTNSSQQNVPATTPGLVGGIRMIRAG